MVVVEVSLEGEAGKWLEVREEEQEERRSLELLKRDVTRGVAAVAVSPHDIQHFTWDLTNKGYNYTIVISDIGRLLQEHVPLLRAENQLNGGVTFQRYMSHQEITAYLEQLERDYPGVVSVKEAGRSVEDRPIYLVVITSNHTSPLGNPKPVIFIDGGVHAREWVSPAASLKVISQVLNDPDMTRDLEWRVMPLVNPDGYITTWDSNRLWRKNRASNSNSRCPGVDLNRNFGYKWAVSGSSSRECSSLYHGSKPFSEPETRAVRDAVLNVANRSEVGRVLDAASGGSLDWATGSAGLPLSYTLELRDEGEFGFLLPPRLLQSSVNDAWHAVRYLAKHIVIKKRRLMKTTTTMNPPTTTTTSTTTTTTTTPSYSSTPNTIYTKDEMADTTTHFTWLPETTVFDVTNEEVTTSNVDVENENVTTSNINSVDVDVTTSNINAIDVRVTTDINEIMNEGVTTKSNIEALAEESTITTIIIDTNTYHPNSNDPYDPNHSYNSNYPNNPNDHYNPNHHNKPHDPYNPNDPCDPSDPYNPNDPYNPVPPNDPYNPVPPNDPYNPVPPNDPYNPNHHYNTDPNDHYNPVPPNDPYNPIPNYHYNTNPNHHYNTDPNDPYNPIPNYHYNPNYDPNYPYNPTHNHPNIFNVAPVNDRIPLYYGDNIFYKDGKWRELDSSEEEGELVMYYSPDYLRSEWEKRSSSEEVCIIIISLFTVMSEDGTDRLEPTVASVSTVNDEDAVVQVPEGEINLCDAEKDDENIESCLTGTKNDDRGGKGCPTSKENDVGDGKICHTVTIIDDNDSEHCLTSTEINDGNIQSNYTRTKKNDEDRISCLTRMEKDERDHESNLASTESNEKDGSSSPPPGIQKDDGDRKGCLPSTENDDEDSPMVIENMIIVDTSGDTDVEEEECSKSTKLEMPEGMSIETEVVTLDDEEISPSSLDVIPLYKADLDGVLTDREFSMVTGKPIANEGRPRRSCFNCDGDHNLSECSKPYDAIRVSTNRKKFQSTRPSNVRYHEDCENKYGQFQPGRLSYNLRHALGLRGNQLPLFVYRMRVLGYPPGWLRDAEVHQADVKMYDGQGKSVIHPDEEEGETEPTTVRYQPDKLISFPGFNDPLPHGSNDECYQYQLPRMQMHHQRSEFLRFMNQNKAQAYRKRKLKGSDDKPSVPIPPSAPDMDVDDKELVGCDIEFNPPLPKEPLPPAPPDAPPPSSPPKRGVNFEEVEVSDADSQDSVSGLEVKRQKLLSELQDTSEGTSTSHDTKDKSQKNSQDDSQTEKPSKENTTSDSKPKRHHRSHSKGFQFGVTIPESCTPFKTLPDVDMWTVDVSDHINFDNLPDALGTWDKMKGLMGQVKKRMTELHKDDDEL
ncbi:hypothetical protein Pmani_000466 [Petrolisthes manimaculis]|uniref:Peptidase M14 domain-containing protein n=1 Tax=Petrolisthes manimaculis TaxID=1843537 RepID=A0AAE1QM35_9EUCA|nr:hypothetical protein Pmani_000466 [Petrolisthes manimaculis]